MTNLIIVFYKQMYEKKIILRKIAYVIHAFKLIVLNIKHYLCLEDNNNRIRDRLLTITDEVTSNVYFVTSCCPLSDGLEEQIKNFVKDHNDTVLIIIDTLQMVTQNSKDTSYANDYKDIETIKRIADELQIAILLVYHMRKQDDKDSINKLSGTNGIDKCEADIQRLNDKINSIIDYNTTIKKRKAEIKESVDIIEQIIKEGAISNANLRLLVDKIIITEKNKKLSVKIRLNAKFQKHKDCYDEDGNLRGRAFTA